MKWLNVLFLSGICSICWSQEVSLRLQFTPDSIYYDSGVRIGKLEPGFAIMGPTACINADNYYVNNCLGLMGTDEVGNLLWTKVYDGGGDTILHDFFLNTLVLHNDTIYTASYVRINGSWGIRLVAFDGSGETLYSKDLAVMNENLFIRQMIFSGNTLILIGILEMGGRSVFIRQFDLEFNLMAEKEIGFTNKTIRKMELSESPDGGFLLAYTESVIASQEKTITKKMDGQFNVLVSGEIPQGELGDPDRAVNIIEIEDNGYIVAWDKDLSDALADTFPFPSTIYKLDSSFQVEWEHVFVHKAYKGHVSLVKTSSGDLLGVGETDYFKVHDIYPERTSDGWCFLMDADGTLLWERTIADNRIDPPSGVFRHGMETANGFVLIGDIGLSLDARTQDVWFLTLDENGCWNGNCNQYIVITGDTTSITYTKESERASNEIKAYPNPTDGILTIECENCKGQKMLRTVQVFDSNGRIIMETSLYAPKSIINLTHLDNGVYIINILSSSGQYFTSKKILVLR